MIPTRRLWSLAIGAMLLIAPALFLLLAGLLWLVEQGWLLWWLLAATGITDGELLHGVRYFGGGARTHTVVMRSKSGTVRFIEATHRWDKLMRYSGIRFD